MADKNGQNRGGYRKPKKPAKRSGIGKNSRRTDGGAQPIRTPGLDHPDLKYGDVQRLKQAQAVVPLPIRQAPAGGPSAPVPPAGSAGGPTPPPDFLFSSPSDRPGEPITNGLPMGPGAGPEALSADLQADPEDIREVVLSFFASAESGYNNEVARDMLNEIRQEKLARKQGPPMGMAPQGVPAQPAPAPPTGMPPMAAPEDPTLMEEPSEEEDFDAFLSDQEEGAPENVPQEAAEPQEEELA